jgi:type II secretory ATPase GspE/PulE/Tfp pilus assembly ATPase PilB-like protein
MLLGEILVKNRVVSSAQVDEALRKKEGKERIGQALLRLGFAKEEEVLKALSEQTHIPYVDLTGVEIDPNLSSPASMKTIFQRKVLPLDRTNGTMRVALSDPLDLEVLDDLRLLLKAKIMPVIGRPSEIDRLIKKHYGVAADEVHRMVNAAKEDIQVIKESSQQADEKALAEDAGLVKFVNQIFTEAVRDRASDIHVEPMEDELRIRYRIDGVLHKVPIPTEIKRFQAAIVSRLKIMSGLNIAEKRLPQDGRIMLNAIGKQIDVRVSVIPNVWGEGVCLRLLDRANMAATLHTNDAPTAVTRLVDMGLEPFLVASTVEGLMAQRLVRRICKSCKVEIKASETEIASLLPQDIKSVWKGKGCEDCRGTGYKGRQGVFELLVVDDEMREMILRREAANRLKKYAIDHGMKTLRDDGWDRVRNGVTSAEEVLRITKSDKY